MKYSIYKQLRKLIKPKVDSLTRTTKLAKITRWATKKEKKLKLLKSEVKVQTNSIEIKMIVL